MKTIALIETLSRKEAKQLEQILKTHKRQKLRVLYKTVTQALKKDKDIEKQHLFKVAFGKIWTTKNDYLLRNELRLLNKEIEQLWVNNAIEASKKTFNYQHQIYLLNTYLERKLYKFYEGHWQFIYKKAQKNYKYDIQLQLLLSFFEYQRKNLENSEANLQSILTTQLATHDIIERQYIEALRESELRLGFLDRSLYLFTQKRLGYTPKTSLNLLESHANNDYAQFLYHSTLSYTQHGIENIDSLKKAIHYLDLVERPNLATNKIKRKSVALASIALTYFLMTDYHAANTYFEKAFELNNTNDPNLLPILFNYVSNCLKLNQYEKVSALIKSHQTTIEKEPALKYRFECLQAMAHIFCKETEAAYDCISYNIHQRPQSEYHYFRFIYIIVFLMREDWDNAERELRNFVQCLRYKSPLERDISTAAKFFHRYIKTSLYTIERSKQKKQLQALVTDIDSFDKWEGLIAKDYLPLKWLFMQLPKQRTND
ncbi:MAG: hypothetical protein ACPGXL_06805 [Chitinophagales bacterium]